jgi:AcrR family transcriptional regulator
VAKKVVEDKRQAILDAALSLFADQGFHGTSVPQIASKAGVAAGTIYRYFDGKEAMVNVLYRHWRETVQLFVLDGFPLGASPREQFGAYWHRLADFAMKFPKAIAFLDFHHHQPYLDSKSLEAEKQGRATLRPFIEEAQQRGQLKAVQPEVIMAITIGALIGLVKASREGNIKLTPALIKDAEEVCWSGISTAGPRAKK